MTTTLERATARLISHLARGRYSRTVAVVNEQPSRGPAEVLHTRNRRYIGNGGSAGEFRHDARERAGRPLSRAGVRRAYRRRALGRLDRVRADWRRNARAIAARDDSAEPRGCRVLGHRADAHLSGRRARAGPQPSKES